MAASLARVARSRDPRPEDWSRHWAVRGVRVHDAQTARPRRLWARRYELVREPRSLSEWTARRPRFDPSLARLTRKHIGHVRPSVASQPKAWPATARP
jgi:hypothetical protein